MAGTAKMADNGGGWDAWLSSLDHGFALAGSVLVLTGGVAGWFTKKIAAAFAAGQRKAKEDDAMKAMRTLVESLIARIETVERIARVETDQLADITKTYRSLPQETAQQFAQTGERMNGHAARLTAMETRYNALDGRIEKLTDRVNETATRKELSDGISAITDRLDRAFFSK